MSTPEIHVDLRGQFGDVRDQGARPTCLAFAASDTHAGVRDGWAPLSCEFAFFMAQRRAGRSPLQGAILSSMLEALRLDGQPLEEGWPYFSGSSLNADEWGPPAEVGTCFARNGTPSGIDLEAVRALLLEARPVILLTMLSPSFFSPRGGVVDPPTGEFPEPSQRHAVIAIGFGEVAGQKAILVRNSWGSDWGIGGHAWLTDRFLAPRLFATALLSEEVNVSSSSIAA